MLKQAKVAATFVLVALSLIMGSMQDVGAASALPDPIKAGVAEKLFRLDCGRSLANDETQHRILVYMLAHEAWKRMVALGCRGS